MAYNKGKCSPKLKRKILGIHQRLHKQALKLNLNCLLRNKYPDDDHMLRRKHLDRRIKSLQVISRRGLLVDYNNNFWLMRESILNNPKNGFLHYKEKLNNFYYI